MKLEALLSATREAHVTAAATFASKQAEVAELRKAASVLKSVTPDPVPTPPEVVEPISIASAWPGLTTEAAAPHVERRGMLWITSTSVLGGLTGSLVGWYLAVARVVWRGSMRARTMLVHGAPSSGRPKPR